MLIQLDERVAVNPYYIEEIHQMYGVPDKSVVKFRSGNEITINASLEKIGDMMNKCSEYYENEHIEPTCPCSGLL